MCIHPLADTGAIGLRHRPPRTSTDDSESSDSEAIMGSSPSGRELKKTRSFLRVVDAVRPAFDARRTMRQIHNDAVVLKSIWLSSLAKSGDHASRLEKFYGPQAAQYDGFRSKFLWGREPLLASCAARLEERKVWVDLGGGTGENVLLMARYMDLSDFGKIYVVDLCPSLCEVARQKLAHLPNVEIVEGDATEFSPSEGDVSLVTFSYSLSMIPPFHAAIDRAVSYLHPENGIMGIADFYVSNKFESLPLRQHSYLRRVFWQSVFDQDGIYLGPERRNYLDHCLSRVWEYNDEGSIPYVPFFRAPYYVGIYKVPKLSTIMVENKVEAPARFPPTFLYTQSWEDPHADAPYLQLGPEDTVLTLTSGGCNSIDKCLHGVKAVYSVDCNPAQNSLLELKRTAIRRLPFEDVWMLFGEGKHPNFERIFEAELAPFLSQKAIKFWKSHAYYFKSGLYFHGGMGKVVAVMQILFRIFGITPTVNKMLASKTIEEQVSHFDRCWLVKLFRHAPTIIVSLLSNIVALLLFNRITLWFGGGIPAKQADLIQHDGVHLSDYAARTFVGVVKGSLIAKDNYFYYSCLKGRFSRDCCPDYLKEENFNKLKDEKMIDALHIVDDFFLPTLRKRTYTRVVLMDHLDWLSDEQAKEVAIALSKHVAKGGRVIWRSAAFRPKYTRFIENSGFRVTCLQAHSEAHEMLDLVNMYASFWLAIKK
jgi:betaine lipid synthase